MIESEECDPQDMASTPDAEEEAEKLSNGYRVTAAPPSYDAPYEGPTFGAPDDGTGDEPTEGAADDETHEKKPKRKKG